MLPLVPFPNKEESILVCGFYGFLFVQLQAEREAQHLLHQEANAEKQRELTLLLKRQNSISRALGIAQSRIVSETETWHLAPRCVSVSSPLHR